MADSSELDKFRHGLNRLMFDELIQELMIQDNAEPYAFSKNQRDTIFNYFDNDQDELLSPDESLNFYNRWYRNILQPKSALIIVDVQNDFISGSLSINKCPAGQQGEQVIPVINKLLDTVAFDLIVYTHDCHPSDHISFIENVDKWKVVAINGEPVQTEQAIKKINIGDRVTIETSFGKIDQELWPKHCVKNTFGASLHPQLKVIPSAEHIFKGTSRELDSYSAFIDNHKKQQTKLNQLLSNVNISDVYVCGIAYDFCVKATALDANSYGYRTVLIDDACRGTDEVKIIEAKKSLIKRGSIIVNADRVLAMVKGRDRRGELAWFWFEKHCLNCEEDH